MKKTIIISTLSLLGALTLHSSCNKTSGTGPIITQTKTVDSFGTVNSFLAADIQITKGATQSLVLEGQQNLLQYINIDVKNGALTITQDVDVQVQSWKSVKIYITVPVLSSLDLKGSGNIKALSDFEYADFNALVTGSGSIELSKINTTDCRLGVTGSGDLKLQELTSTKTLATITGSGEIEIDKGSSDDVEIRVQGSGDFEGDRNFHSSKAKVTVSGSGSAYISVKDQLTGTITGSGNIVYYGNPTKDVSVTGSGKVSQGN